MICLSVEQLSPTLFSCCSIYVTYIKLIHLNDLFDNVTFLFSEGCKNLPRTHSPTHTITHSHTHTLTYSQTPLLEPPALQAMPGLKKYTCFSYFRGTMGVCKTIRKTCFLILMKILPYPKLSKK